MRGDLPEYTAPDDLLEAIFQEFFLPKTMPTEKQLAEEIKALPKDKPLKCGEIARLGLLGNISRVRVHQIVSDPKNGFTKIPPDGKIWRVTLADCERYWETKKPGIFARL